MGLSLCVSESDSVLTDTLLASHAMRVMLHGILASLLSTLKVSLIGAEHQSLVGLPALSAGWTYRHHLSPSLVFHHRLGSLHVGL